MAVFVSYRHTDGALVAPIVSELESSLAGIEVFRDVDDLRPGQDWRQELDRALEGSSVFLPIIGPGWVKVPPNDADPEDWVAKEIIWAVDRKLDTIPVHVGLREVVDPDGLPAAIRPIFDKQGLIVDHRAWRGSVDRLIDGVRERLTATRGLPDLSGTWIYREENQEFGVRQLGDTLEISFRDPTGRLVPVGRGTVSLDRMHAQIELQPYGTIDLKMRILHDGSVLEGEGYNPLEGSYPVTLVRSR